MKKLNGLQIDFIRRTIQYLIGKDGIARLVFLAPILLSSNESGFIQNGWCGYGKLKKLLEAYPEVFELYFNDLNNDLAVRIVNRHSDVGSIPNIDPDDFESFFNSYFTAEKHKELSSEFKLNAGLEIYCICRNYLIYNFHKAVSEGKILKKDDARMVHTGWFQRDTDPIYIIWGVIDNRPGLWFLRRSGQDARDLIKIFGDKVPEMVHYPIQQFDPSLHIEPEFGHIFDERSYRIPTEVMDMVRSNPNLPIENRDCDTLELVVYCRNYLRRLLIGCVADTQYRLINRRDEAVQFWDKRRDKMCWLIPLRMGITEKANLALVLEPCTLNDIAVYRAHTILSLKEAFKCARLLGPVRAEWLLGAWTVSNI